MFLNPLQVALWARYIPDLLIALLLLVVGGGLLRSGKWARKFGVTVGMLLIISIAWGIPGMLGEWMINLPAPQQGASAFTIAPYVSYVGYLIVIFLEVALGVAMLIVLRRPEVRNAFEDTMAPAD